MPPTDGDVRAAVDRMLDGAPSIETETFSTTLAVLCNARDDTSDPVRRGDINRLISLVMAVRHPLDAPPWDALRAARAALAPTAT